MSSSSYLDNLRFATRQIYLYGGLFIFITGVFGNLFNITVFTTLRTFRQTTCSFYLIITSIANIGLIIIPIVRVFYEGLNIGLSYTSLLCKFHFSWAQFWISLSLTTMSLATFDQFISMTTYKEWSNLRIARRLIAFVCVLSFIDSIFPFIYYDSYLNTCIATSAAFAKYVTYFQVPLVLGFVPLTAMIIFSLLAFFKIRTIASRQINIVRLSRDRQLTAMTLFHVLSVMISITPFLIVFAYTLSVNLEDPIDIAQIQLIYAATVHFYYMSYSYSFYIYCCVSKRFRKQVTYVLIDIHLNRWRRRINNINNNQVTVYPMQILNEHRRPASVSANAIVLY